MGVSSGTQHKPDLNHRKVAYATANAGCSVWCQMCAVSMMHGHKAALFLNRGSAFLSLHSSLCKPKGAPSHPSRTRRPSQAHVRQPLNTPNLVPTASTTARRPHSCMVSYHGAAWPPPLPSPSPSYVAPPMTPQLPLTRRSTTRAMRSTNSQTLLAGVKAVKSAGSICM